MSLQFSVAVRNAILDAIESGAANGANGSGIGAGAKLAIFTGALPASCAAAEAGTKLVEFTLAADWVADATGGSKSFNNTPLSVAAVAGGNAGHFRIFASDGTTCHVQGTVTATGGGGDMTVDNTNIAAGQTVSVTSFTLTAPGA